MKRILIIGLFMLMFNAVSANAANGDVIQPIYSTDILTYMDGIPIKGYNIGGQTLICLEDLSNYGFSVYYCDEVRCLFVNKTGNAKEGFFPTIEKNAVGEIIGYTYETDIRAILNGEEIDAVNIGGKLAVTAEELNKLKDKGLNGSFSIENNPKYFMTSVYNDSSRVLKIYSDISVNYLYNDNINKFETDMEDAKAYTSAEIIDKYVCGEYTQYIHRGAFRYAFSPDRSITAVRFYKNGRILDYTNILDTYSFIGTPIGTSVYGDDNKNLRFSDDGKYLIFKANRTAYKFSLMGSRDTFESGEYKLNLDTCELEKVNITTYDIN